MSGLVRGSERAAPYSGRVIAVTLEQARTAALVVAGVLGVLAVGSAWLMKTVVQKVVVVVLLAGAAVLVWSQRAALQDCADEVRTETLDDDGVEPTCTFFGRDVTVPTGD